MNEQLNFILNKRPSIIRNSFLVYLIWFVFWILTLLFAISGLACVIGGDIQKAIVLDPMVKTNLLNVDVSNLLFNNTKKLGICLLILGVFCSLVIWLCKRLIERNLFLIDLEDWRRKEEENNSKAKEFFSTNK